jgi:FAD/FMN-containing dehydrogenase
MTRPARRAQRRRQLQPSDSSFDDARKVHNGLIDKRPFVIVQCRTATDIAAALQFARAHSLPVSVRVDPVERIAVAEGGATWADFNRATQQHGLATTGGLVSSTGVAGRTLGGGLGWLMGLHGMAVDNLIGAEIVTADGSVLNVSETDHPDLFWAIRDTRRWRSHGENAMRPAC